MMTTKLVLVVGLPGPIVLPLILSAVIALGIAVAGIMGCAAPEVGCGVEGTDCKSIEYDPFETMDPGNGSANPPEGMVLIPAETFEMGISEEDLDSLVTMGRNVPHMSLLHAKWWFGDEVPEHMVDVGAFYMDSQEVTNEEFGEFVAETAYEAHGNWQEYATEGREQHPVIAVSWHDAEAYCEWAGKRLPTEAEWEYAAKGGKDVKWFPWGDTPDGTCANYRYQGETILTPLLEGGRVRTKPVGCYLPNGFGLYDMCGNVREWCEDERLPYPDGPEEEWIYTRYGPFRTDEEPVYGRAARGGSWDSPNAVFVRLNERSGREPEDGGKDLGFRCVRPAE